MANIGFQKNEVSNLERKIKLYKEVLANTRSYRDIWHKSLKEKITNIMEIVCKECELDATVEVVSHIENLEAVRLNLGEVKSGIWEQVNTEIKRHLIKNNGSLIYQQLFNGKIMVIIQYPHIDNIGQPPAPKTVGIYRPEELKEPFFLRHLEEFMQEIINWEDYDDDEPNQKIGFSVNFAQPPEN